MILRDGDERLTLNMKHDTASYSNHPHRESVNLINIFNLSREDCLEDLVSNKQSGNPTFLLHKEIASPEVIHEIHDSRGCTFLSEELPDINSFNDIHPYFNDDPLSGSTTYSANSLLEEFADELALITYPPDYNRTCDIESDIKEIDFLLYQGEDFDFKDSIDQSDLAHCDDLFVDPTPEMFTDEQPPYYSFLLRFDVYPDDFLEIESNNDFSRDDDLPSPDNEDKVFNLGILIHEKSVTIITRVTQEKKLAVSYASLLFEDFNPLIYELLVFKEVPNLMRLLLFSSENEEKVFKPGIYTFKKVKEYQEKDKIESKPDKNEKRTKLMAVTPKKNDKKIRLTKHILSSGNTTVKTTSSTNVVSNTPVLFSTRVNLLSSASGSQPRGNTKNDRIQRAPSKAKKNKLEDHHRTVRPSLNKKKSVVDTKAISSVTNSKLNVNTDLKCATCNGCLFSDNNDSFILTKYKSVKTPVKRKVWKPTGNMFKTVGHIWKSTGRTFKLVGNVCPLTRISTPTIVPPREPIPLINSMDKPVVTLVYTRKPKAANKKVPNKLEPNNSWGSSSSNVPSSLLTCRLSKSSSGTWTPVAQSI
nr:hypothetical protein [Tanacetum cinerariifolium]